MATKNDVTGDTISSKSNSDAYRDGYDAIFGKKSRPSLNSEEHKQEKGKQDGSIIPR